jgi:hypothetical protein
MTITRKHLTLKEVRLAFHDVGETLNDLTSIRIALIRDVHDESHEMTIEIFGMGNPDESAPVCEYAIDLYHLCTEEILHSHGMKLDTIIQFFDTDLLNELIMRHIRITCNARDETQVVLDPSNPGTGYLQPMER